MRRPATFAVAAGQESRTMLDTLRRQGASIVIYIVFGILIAVFVVNFGGPGSGGCGDSSGGGDETVMTVDGARQRMPAWRWTVNYLTNFTGGRVPKSQRAELALELLLRRELLAAEGERRGLQVSDTLIDERIKAGELYIADNPIDGKSLYFEQVGTESFFNYDMLLNLTRNLGLTIGAFKEQQRREILAQLTADLLRGSGRASKDEAQSRYIAENTTVSYDVVRFVPQQYGDAMAIADADVERYLAAHATEVKDRFTADERLYKAVKPELRIRQIFVAKAEPPATDAGAGSAAPPTDAKDAGVATLEAARTAITSGKRTFIDAAKAIGTDPAAKARGGDLGWRSKDAPALEDPKLGDAVRALKVGEVSPVVTTDAGAYLVTVEAERAGDLTFDQVKLEIASGLAQDAWADEAARRAAIAALTEAQGKKLGDLYPRAEPEMSPEEQLRLQQEMQRRFQEMENGGGPRACSRPDAALDRLGEPGRAGRVDGRRSAGWRRGFGGPGRGFGGPGRGFGGPGRGFGGPGRGFGGPGRGPAGAGGGRRPHEALGRHPADARDDGEAVGPAGRPAPALGRRRRHRHVEGGRDRAVRRDRRGWPGPAHLQDRRRVRGHPGRRQEARRDRDLREGRRQVDRGSRARARREGAVRLAARALQGAQGG